MPLEKAHAEVSLNVEDLPADGRLRDVEHARRHANGSSLCDGQDITK
jgi:hypothetical protein